MHILPPTCTTQVGTIDSLKEESLYDTVLYIDVMEHIESDADEFRKAEEHLLPGGHLIVLSPAHPALFSPFDSAIGHFRRYNRRSLQRLGRLPSLTTVRLVYLDSVGLAASLANRVLLKHSMPTSTQIHLWDSVLVRLSMLIDPILLNKVGKTIVGIWKKS
jgi:2-polyprenyl-3-methyl-5-hydroxy-6-metoxy-1,4-benzoquinol methylase